MAQAQAQIQMEPDIDVAPYQPRYILETLPAALPTSHFSTDQDFESIAAPLIRSLDRLDAAHLSNASIWRDVFALTGTLRTLYSAESIVEAWSATCASREAEGFEIIDKSAHVVRLDSDVGWVNVNFVFRCRGSPATTCRGIVSLVLDGDGQWKIWLLRTILEQLEGCGDVDNLHSIHEKGHEMSGSITNGVGVNRETSPSPDGPDSTGAGTHHFDCVIVGAGQGGLGSAGRLQALGVSSYVVLDKHAKIGDNWMTRYESARLHTAREYNHLPFDRTFPLPYQEYLTKFDLARGYRDWIEKFGVDKHIWFSTTLEGGSWDEEKKTWTLNLRRSSSSDTNTNTITITCKHLIMAVGSGGQIPKMPQYAGQSSYKGTILHSSSYTNANPWHGKAGIIIGTANTAHDIAEDMLQSGLSSVTMVQRTRTYVLPCEYFKTISDRTYNASTRTVDADRDGYSMPYALTRLLSRRALHAMAAQEPKRFDDLEGVGFAVERYGDIMWHICEKMGGHYMDVGCSDKIVKGLIKIKSTALPTHFTPTGLSFNDGTTIPADVIVFSTGFEGNMRSEVARLFGEKVASRADDFWGLDEEGELVGAFKRNSHPNLFYVGGTIGHCRYFSRHVALQIKADLMGSPLPVYEGQRRREATGGEGRRGEE